jgi:hypothetical protein
MLPEEAVVLLKALAIATLLLTLHLVAGCAATGNRSTVTADRLTSAADAFAARSDSSLPLAHDFSDEAREFRRTLVDRLSERDVLLAYERLWRRYHALGYEVSRSGDHALRENWRAVTAAFADVQQHVKARYSEADPALYSRGGYGFDPYYN